MHSVLLPAAGRCRQPGASRCQGEPCPGAGADLPTTGCRPGGLASHLREARDSTGTSPQPPGLTGTPAGHVPITDPSPLPQRRSPFWIRPSSGKGSAWCLRHTSKCTPLLRARTLRGVRACDNIGPNTPTGRLFTSKSRQRAAFEGSRSHDQPRDHQKWPSCLLSLMRSLVYIANRANDILVVFRSPRRQDTHRYLRPPIFPRRECLAKARRALLKPIFRAETGWRTINRSRLSRVKGARRWVCSMRNLT